VTDRNAETRRESHNSVDQATKSTYRLKLPQFIIQESVGLGEVIKRGTTALGIRSCQGCEQRAAQLDRRFRFEPRR
jgi:hypothetical protein